MQDIDITTPTTATISEFEMPSTGTFYIMVMRGSGAEGDASGSFTLKLSGFQQIGGQTITLTNGGIVFELVWNAAVNLNLEVRDPGWRHGSPPASRLAERRHAGRRCQRQL